MPSWKRLREFFVNKLVSPVEDGLRHERCSILTRWVYSDRLARHSKRGAYTPSQVQQTIPIVVRLYWIIDSTQRRPARRGEIQHFAQRPTGKHLIFEFARIYLKHNPLSHFSRTPTCDRHTQTQVHSMHRSSIAYEVLVMRARVPL